MTIQFVFVGNRRFVLEEMLALGMQISKIFVVKGTHLERDLSDGVLKWLGNYEVIASKKCLIERLNSLNYDLLVSNGCPYILPISELPKARYVNIHPSLLPDLRGYDPVIGSVLYRRDSGATCHVMDNGIDTGDIISQVPIEYTDDLDVTTLYQLSFLAEKEALREAYKVSFEPLKKQGEVDGIIEYKRDKSDWYINFQESNERIAQKIKAFNNLSQGCRFLLGEDEYKVFGIQVMKNPFLAKVVFEKPEGEVVFSYEGCVIFHKDNEILRLTGVEPIVDGLPIVLEANLVNG
ncbi:formyltransferase family protein [Eionea flava]